MRGAASCGGVELRCENRAVSPRLRAAAAGLVLLCATSCGNDDPGRAPARAASPTPTARPEQPAATVRRARCPADAVNCAAVTGRVIYVEPVDPDGDGDAHYVLAGGDVTAPGVSVIDVERALRPRRLARFGELVSAAGPVYRGSYGQHQIQATELHQQHARRGERP
jgi:hypothetical protein